MLKIRKIIGQHIKTEDTAADERVVQRNTNNSTYPPTLSDLERGIPMINTGSNWGRRWSPPGE